MVMKIQHDQNIVRKWLRVSIAVVSYILTITFDHSSTYYTIISMSSISLPSFMIIPLVEGVEMVDIDNDESISPRQLEQEKDKDVSNNSKEENDRSEMINDEPVDPRSIHNNDQPITNDTNENLYNNNLSDDIEDGFYDPFAPDPSCYISNDDDKSNNDDCWQPPQSTIETESILIDATAMYGGDDPSDNLNEDDELDDNNNEEKNKQGKKAKKIIDMHWGSDENILKMRDRLRNAGKGTSANYLQDKKRSPIFLMPGLASTRLVSWRYKTCSNALLSDVKVQDYVWMNINMLLHMATIDSTCFLECMTLGLNQTDMDDDEIGCKLRPDEGLDAISSLAPGSVTTNMLVGGKNTVYAWLTQWLADNLGYDVSSIVGLPYDWRLSPDVMEKRDGFLTLTRKRIEASVASNGLPGIMVAHSMGNNVFRYFLEWLKNEMHEEAYQKLLKKAKKKDLTIRGDPKAFLRPGWTNAQTNIDSEKIHRAVEPIVEYSVADQMFTLATSVVNSIDDLLHSYFPGDETGEQVEIDWTKLIKEGEKHPQLWELAKEEGDEAWLDWIHDHIWTYIGLSAPLLGAINPVRAVLSGENMGMPMDDKLARKMELSFGSTHTINPVSTKTGFCDDESKGTDHDRSNLACLNELIDGIEKSVKKGKDPWHNFPALKSILKERVDWDSTFPLFTARREMCLKSEKPPCQLHNETYYNAKDIQNGELLSKFSEIWKEAGEPLKVKKKQLENSWWFNPLPNILNSTWDRPHIKHVIMAYGVDYETEVGYVYRKIDRSDKEVDEGYDDMPTLKATIWEEAGGKIFEENKLEEKKSLTNSVLMKKTKKKRALNVNGEKKFHRSGDASVPYLSLAWSHTWLLHATRAMRRSGHYGMKEGERISDDNALDSIKVTYRPKGGSEWLDIAKAKDTCDANAECEEENSDTGSAHPHGTKYKPEMYRYQSKGKSRSTGMQYTTAVIEALGVEHKETTRNYDILAAVFTDVLKYMHEDFDLV